MATLAARLSNTGTYYVSGGFDENTLSSNGFLSLSYGNTRYFGAHALSGSTDPLTGANTASNTWTFETWTYYDGVSNGTTSYPIQADGGTTNGYFISIVPFNTAGLTQANFTWSNGAQQFTVSSGGATILNNQWNHLVVQKINATQISFYLNGTSIGTATATTNIYWPTYSGGSSGTNISMYGITGYRTYIGATRMVSGAVLYSSNFTPNYLATANISTIGTTTLLINPNISNGSAFIQNIGTLGTLFDNNNFATKSNYTPLNINSNNYITTKLYSNGVHQIAGGFDEVSSNNTTFATTGATNTKAKIYSNGVFAISNTGYFDEISYPTGSISFPGGGFSINQSYVDVYSNFLNFGASTDFTVEGWFNLASLTASFQGTVNGGIIWGIGTILASTGVVQTASQMLSYVSSSGNLTYNYCINNNTSTLGTPLSFGNITTNTWYHFAVTRSGTTYSSFLNGTVISRTSTAIGTPGGGLISPQTYQLGNITGNIGNFKITRGRSLYNNNFTPSDYPLKPEGDTIQLLSTANTIGFDSNWVNYNGAITSRPWYADISGNRFHLSANPSTYTFSANTPFS